MGAVTGRVWAALSVVYVVWGSTYLAIRWTVATVPALLSAGARFAVAGLLMTALALTLHGRAPWRVSRDQVGWAALSGVLLLAGGNGLIVLAETRVPSGLAALLVAIVPLWLVLLRLLLGDRVRGLTVGGVLLGLAGAAVLLLPGSGRHADLAYCVLVLGAALSWAAGSLVATRLPVPADALVLSAIEMLAGGGVLLAMSGLHGEWGELDVDAISLRSWLSIVYLVVFGSLIAFSAYAWVLTAAPISLVATYAYVNPAVAVALGVLFAGERLTATEVLGGAVIVAAVAVVVRSEGRTRCPALALE